MSLCQPCFQVLLRFSSLPKSSGVLVFAKPARHLFGSLPGGWNKHVLITLSVSSARLKGRWPDQTFVCALIARLQSIIVNISCVFFLSDVLAYVFCHSGLAVYNCVGCLNWLALSNVVLSFFADKDPCMERHGCGCHSVWCLAESVTSH